MRPRRPGVQFEGGDAGNRREAQGPARRAARRGGGLQQRGGPRPDRAGLPFRRRRPRRADAPLRLSVHRAPRRRRAHLRGAAARRADARGRAPPRRRRGHRDRHRGRPRRVRRRGGPPRRGRHQADADQLPEPRAGGGGELPQDDRRDVRGRPRDPDQARGPAAQHADDRVPRQAEADPEGEGDARGLRAARTSPRHPRDQVGARGPRVPDAAPAQVRGDQDDGRGAARRPRGPRRRGGGRPPPRAREGRHPRGDLRPREALLFDLRQDGRRRAASSTRSTTSPPCA